MDKQNVKFETVGVLFSLISGTSYGTYSIFAKLAYGAGLNETSLIFFRCAGTTLLLYTIIKFNKSKGKKYVEMTNTHKVKILLLGAVIYAAMTGCYLASFIKIPASIASMIYYLYPAFVTILSILLKIERFDLTKGLALILAGSGMMLLLNTSFGQIDPIGIIYALAAAITYTIYILLGNNLMKSSDPMVASMYLMAGVAITYGILGLTNGELTFNISAKATMYIILIIFVSTILGLVLFWQGTKIIGPSKASIISMVEPLVTIILACIVFKEAITGF